MPTTGDRDDIRRRALAAASADIGSSVALHRFQAEPEVYGAASFLMLVHIVRALAGRDPKAKRYWTAVLEHAAKDAAKLDNDFGKQTAALIRRVMILNPLLDPESKN